MSEITQCLSFCEWLISLSIMSSRFIHTAACVRGSFLFKAEQYSTVYMYHILFIHLSNSGYLDCFHLLVSVNNTIINMKIGIQIPLRVSAFISLGYIFKSRMAGS